MRQRRASTANQCYTARDFISEKHEIQRSADRRQDNENVLKTINQNNSNQFKSAHRCSCAILRRPDAVEGIRKMRTAFTQVKHEHRTTCAKDKCQIAFISGLKGKKSLVDNIKPWHQCVTLLIDINQVLASENEPKAEENRVESALAHVGEEKHERHAEDKR